MSFSGIIYVMSPSTQVIDFLNVIKSQVVIPISKAETGVLWSPSIPVGSLLTKIKIKRSELEDYLHELRSLGFILKYSLQDYPKLGESLEVVPVNDFLTRYDEYLNKNYTDIRIDLDKMVVIVGDSIISFTERKHLEILVEIFTKNEAYVEYSELSDSASKTNFHTIRSKFRIAGHDIFESVGNRHSVIKRVYLNRFKP